MFFPRYLEMFNNLVEDWCRDELGFSFAEIHRGRGWGLPTVHLEVDFVAPSVVGEMLAATLRIERVGASSLSLAIRLQGPDGGDRVLGTMVVVLLDPRTRRGIAFPDELRARLVSFHTG